MATLRITVLLVAAALGVVALGVYVGAGISDRRIAEACVTKRQASLRTVHIECALAPGWRDR